MTHATSEDIFLGRKQEDFDLAEKLLIKHGKLSAKCVREMADALYGRMGIAECYKILQRVWNDMHVKRLEDENAKLRKLVNSYADLFDRYAAMNNGCGPYYSGEDWLALANDMRIELAECCGELGVEVNDA